VFRMARGAANDPGFSLLAQGRKLHAVVTARENTSGRPASQGSSLNGGIGKESRVPVDTAMHSQ